MLNYFRLMFASGFRLRKFSYFVLWLQPYQYIRLGVATLCVSLKLVERVQILVWIHFHSDGFTHCCNVNKYSHKFRFLGRNSSFRKIFFINFLEAYLEESFSSNYCKIPPLYLLLKIIVFKSLTSMSAELNTK